MAMQWYTLELSDATVVMPRICPNCLAEASVPFVTGYTRAGLSSTTTFKHTFYYCEPCGAVLNYDKWKRPFSILPGLLLTIFAILGPIGLLSETLPKPAPAWVAPAAILWACTAVVIVWVIIPWLTRKVLRIRNSPLPVNALGREPAAQYRGTASYYNLSGKDLHIFAALRPEWYWKFVEANLTLVSDEVYKKATGQERQRPF